MFLSAIALDLEGTYDNILHESFVREFVRLNSPSDLLQILAGFLKRTTFFTTDGVHKSDTYHIQKGVPQGFSLSAFLFSLYMTMFLRKVQEVPVMVARAYADDILI